MVVDLNITSYVLGNPRIRLDWFFTVLAYLNIVAFRIAASKDFFYQD